MDNRVIHLHPYPRMFGLLPPVETIGCVPGKTEAVTCVFRSCNFSFILAGRGAYVYRGGVFPVEAPCVLLQWPGEPMDYGPAQGTAWTELFLIYSESALAKLKRSGAFTPGEPPVRRIAVDVSDAVLRLQDRLDAAQVDADGIDAACWDLIVSSFSAGPFVDVRHRAVERCREHLRRHLAGGFDASAMAESLGMSLSSLRRCWASVHGRETFSDYRDTMLLQGSCRMLVETQASVKEIAGSLGFSDVYYFSRRFRQLAGCTPTAYRNARGVHQATGG